MTGGAGHVTSCGVAVATRMSLVRRMAALHVLLTLVHDVRLPVYSSSQILLVAGDAVKASL